jgi:2'-5' RNA ligase
MPFPLYGTYLLPPTGLAAQIDTLRADLEKRYGSHSARSFMVHCTLKGFFRLAENKTDEQLQQALSPVLATFPAFEVQPKAITQVLSTVLIDLASRENPRLEELSNVVFHQIDPEFVHPECPFTSAERRYGFAAHITLASLKDRPDSEVEEATAFARQAAKEHNLLQPFLARKVVLYRFTTQHTAWDDSERCWEKFQYTALHTWRLRSGCLSNLWSFRQPEKDAQMHYA